MLVILIMVAGVALMFGAKDFASQIAKGVLGAVLALAVIPCLAESCTRAMPGASAAGSALASGGLFLLVAVVLAAIGFLAWRRRADRTKARELWARRNGASRVRALPPPPSPTEEGRS